MKYLTRMISRIMSGKQTRRMWKRVRMSLASVIVFATVYMMILPAITINKETAIEQAGIYLEEDIEEAGGVSGNTGSADVITADPDTGAEEWLLFDDEENETEQEDGLLLSDGLLILEDGQMEPEAAGLADDMATSGMITDGFAVELDAYDAADAIVDAEPFEAFEGFVISAEDDYLVEDREEDELTYDNQREIAPQNDGFVEEGKQEILSWVISDASQDAFEDLDTLPVVDGHPDTDPLVDEDYDTSSSAVEDDFAIADDPAMVYGFVISPEDERADAEDGVGGLAAGMETETEDLLIDETTEMKDDAADAVKAIEANLPDAEVIEASLPDAEVIEANLPDAEVTEAIFPEEEAIETYILDEEMIEAVYTSKKEMIEAAAAGEGADEMSEAASAGEDSIETYLLEIETPNDAQVMTTEENNKAETMAVTEEEKETSAEEAEIEAIAEEEENETAAEEETETAAEEEEGTEYAAEEDIETITAEEETEEFPEAETETVAEAEAEAETIQEEETEAVTEEAETETILEEETETVPEQETEFETEVETETETISEAEIETETEAESETETETETEEKAEERIVREIRPEGADYTIFVEYSSDAGLSRNTQFTATVLNENSGFDRFSTSAKETVEGSERQEGSENGNDFSRTDLLGLFDLTIFDENGNTVQPAEDVMVRVVFDNGLWQNAKTYAVHFPGTGPAGLEQLKTEMDRTAGSSLRSTEALQAVSLRSTAALQNSRTQEALLNADMNTVSAAVPVQGAFETTHTSLAQTGLAAEVIDARSNENEISFETSGFSVYAIVGTTIEKTVLASDGHNYRITVTYEAETGIPADADLEVNEILGTSALYEAYVSRSETALGMEEGAAEYIRLFDISIVNRDDHSVKYQPAEGTTVDVQIELADSETEELGVVHFADADDTGSVVEAKTEGQTVTFAAEGFSVYSVVSRESATGNTDLDGKTYVLVTNNNALLMGQPLASDAGKLAAISANPTVGGTLQVNGSVTMWTFEAVSGQPGWYYISDGNGNYLNVTSASGNGGTVTLGARQPIYVASKGSGDSITYQLRNGETQNGSKAVNNYGNNWSNGFGAWTSSNANNDWFRFYDMELLGDYSVSFNANGGTGAVPSPIWGLAGDSVILPDYSGTRTGYTFLGWSTGSNLVNKDYYPVYPAGSAYTLPDKNTTLYAVWTAASPAQGQFFIRLDGTIPYEPDQYDSSAYTSAINITGAIRNQVWVTDNDVFKYNNGLYIENDVTANLNQVPNVDQLVSNINGSSGKLGFKVQNMNGEIVVSEITNAATNRNNYNVSVGNALYVLWYVQKYAGSWHVDGTLLVKDKVSISYVGNAPDGSVKSVPLGYQEDVGTEVTIGASGGKNGPLRTPTRPGYIFLGWNLKADGSGTWYNNGDSYTLNEDTTLYAQWSKGTNMMTVAKMNEDGETLAGAQFKLEEKTAAGAFIEKANRTTGANGTFTYDMMENDTLYRMTETYAPNGYEVQNSFYFKVAVADSGSSDLNLRVCDENGNYIETPEWLQIDYLPADDPGVQGVARIQFHIKDERIQRNFTFIKVDEEGNPLPGAEYTLTNAKGTVSGVLKEQSGSDGVFSVENAVLPYGTYTLTESRPPVTFAANEPVIFTLNDYVSESENGLTINEDRSGSVIEADCEVSSVTEQGLTVTTYAYTIKVQDIRQAHIIVTKDVAIDGDLNPQDLDTTIYYALTKKGEEGYVKKENGELWIERMDIVNGVPTPEQVVFDGVDFGEYDVWEMALIGGEYTRMYSGLVVAGNFQLDSVAASSADGGNNANVSDSDLEARVEFTNHYGKITQSTFFTANKRWTKRDGTTIVAPPEHAVIEFTLYSEKKDASGQIIEGSLAKVRSIELDGAHDPDGEDTPWTAVFKYLPVYDENNLEYVYKVKETVTVDGYYPNEYPQEYYLTNSGGTITNRELKTDVELHKHFEIYPENADLPGAAEGLAFTLTLPDQTTQSFTLADFAPSAEDPNDYVLTIRDLPLGAYSFTEAGQEDLLSEAGYNLIYSVSSAEGEAEAGSPQEQPVLQLELQNNYAKSGMLIVRKNSILHEAVDETTVPEEISGKEFPFVVRRGSLYLQENGTVGTTPYVFTLTEGTAKEFASVPAGQYTVIEQDSSVDGYLWEVVDGTRNADGTWSKSLTIADAESAGEASFDNRYTKIENGSLTVSKTVVGGPEEAGTKAYKVEIKTTRHDEPVWLDADGNLTTEKTILSVTADQPLVFPTVPAGTYTVTEDEADAAFKDYALQVTYSKESPFTIHKDGQEEVQITNTYNYLFTPVKITKTVTGNMGDKNLYFGFDAYVTDAEGQPVVVEGVTNSNGLIQFNLKHGEEKLLAKLPKGARLRIVEHNVHYTTTVAGFVGLDQDPETADPLTAEESHSDLPADTTETYTFLIPDDGATVHFTNDYTVEPPVVLKKVGYDNRDGSITDLAGATFRIYLDAGKTRPVELDGKTEFTSGEDGVFYSGRLGVGTYYLEETVVPDGYNAPYGMFILRVGVNGITLGSTSTIGQPDLSDWVTSETQPGSSEPEETDPESELSGNSLPWNPQPGESIYTVSIRNTAGVSLPNTGGAGTAAFYLIGILLMVLAGAGAVMRRR